MVEAPKGVKQLAAERTAGAKALRREGGARSAAVVLGSGGGGARRVGEVGSGDPRGDWTSPESPGTLLPARGTRALLVSALHTHTRAAGHMSDDGVCRVRVFGASIRP